MSDFAVDPAALADAARTVRAFRRRRALASFAVAVPAALVLASGLPTAAQRGTGRLEPATPVVPTVGPGRTPSPGSPPVPGPAQGSPAPGSPGSPAAAAPGARPGSAPPPPPAGRPSATPSPPGRPAVAFHRSPNNGTCVAPGPAVGLWCGSASWEAVAGGTRLTYEICLGVGNEPVTASFPTEQEVELTVSRDGAEVWRWSAGPPFAPAPHEVTFAPGECAAWSVVWAGPRGTYELVASGTDSGGVLPRGYRVTFGR